MRICFKSQIKWYENVSIETWIGVSKKSPSSSENINEMQTEFLQREIFPQSGMHNVSYLNKGYCCILVINDQFSEYIQTYPVRDRTAEIASTWIIYYFLWFSVFKNFCSDRDSGHAGDLFRFRIKGIRVHKLQKTGYDPQTNGLTEQLMFQVKTHEG